MAEPPTTIHLAVPVGYDADRRRAPVLRRTELRDVGRIGVDEDRRHLRDEKLQTMIPNEPKITSDEIVAHNRSVGSGDLRGHLRPA